MNVQLSPSSEDLLDSYGCGEDYTTCPNETTCCKGKQKCCPVENSYNCCPIEDENVSISSLLIPCLPSSSDRENKYSNVVSLSISAPWSNRGGLKATHSQRQLYNHLPLVRLFAVQTGTPRSAVTASSNVLPTAALNPVWCEQNLRT